MTPLESGGLRDFLELYALPPQSFADQYPNVPRPYPPLAPQLLVAKWRCHDIYGEEMPSIAADLLEEGYDSPSLRRLAGETQVTCSADVEELVAKMFQELSVPYPILGSEAREILTVQAAREVIAGKQNPWNAARLGVVAVWDGTGSNSDELCEIAEIRDALDWNAINSGQLPQLTADLIGAFARLGARKTG